MFIVRTTEIVFDYSFLFFIYTHIIWTENLLQYVWELRNG